ncbi:MAG: PspC domain-containing protein [Actinomycetaceae bacterium]|nr:PspC domain-containing protein [Actinomycetaceae bacterium]
MAARFGMYRPRRGRWAGGVCLAVANRFGVSALFVRALTVASCLLPGPQFLAYVALWLLIPSED